MAKNKPAYRRHKARKQAVVILPYVVTKRRQAYYLATCRGIGVRRRLCDDGRWDEPMPAMHVRANRRRVTDKEDGGLRKLSPPYKRGVRATC